MGVSCGILDQYTSVLGQAGHALLLDCRHLESQPVPIASHLAVVICDTRAERQLGATGYAERRAACETGVARLRSIDPGVRALRDVSPAFLAAHEAELPPEVARRCRFIVEEDRRVLEFAEALPVGDVATLGALFDASYEGATRLFEMGAPAMTAMHDAMAGAPGLIARRQAGGGFGGCLVALVEPAAVPAFSAAVARAYEAATGIQPRNLRRRGGAGSFAGGVARRLVEHDTRSRVESRAHHLVAATTVLVPSASGEGLLDDLRERPPAGLRQLVADTRDGLVQLQQPSQVDGRGHEHEVRVDALEGLLSSSICVSL